MFASVPSPEDRAGPVCSHICYPLPIQRCNTDVREIHGKLAVGTLLSFPYLMPPKQSFYGTLAFLIWFCLALVFVYFR